MERIIRTLGLPGGLPSETVYTFSINVRDLLVNIPGTHQGMDSAIVHFPEQEAWLKSLGEPKLRHVWPCQFALDDEAALTDFLNILAPAAIP